MVVLIMILHCKNAGFLRKESSVEQILVFLFSIDNKNDLLYNFFVFEQLQKR